MAGGQDRIVVGFDGSDVSMRAVMRAAELAQHLGCGVTLVTAAADRLPHRAPSAAHSNPIQEAKEVVERGAALARSLGVTDLRVTLSLEAPDDALALEARDGCRMLVVGHRGLNPVSSLLMGSTAKALVDRAPCSLLVVR